MIFQQILMFWKQRRLLFMGWRNIQLVKLFSQEIWTFLAFNWNVALDGAFVISRPLKDAGTWRTDRLRAASLVPLRLELSGSVSALINAPPRVTSRQNLKILLILWINFLISSPREKQPAKRKMMSIIIASIGLWHYNPKRSQI